MDEGAANAEDMDGHPGIRVRMTGDIGSATRQKDSAPRFAWHRFILESTIVGENAGFPPPETRRMRFQLSKPPPSSAASWRRARIASLAARLMAENGIGNYSAAKRKAASILGLPANARLPENAEVESELRTYQRLFQEDEQGKRLADLRKKAIEFMEIVQGFNPYLSGAVLDGTAGRGAGIDIQLFTDSAKDVEIFLINEHIEYRHSPPRSERAEAVLTVDGGGTAINLIVYPRQDERVVFRARDGRVRPRARIDAVRRLRADPGGNP